jgi:hypothetical protein
MSALVWVPGIFLLTFASLTWHMTPTVPRYFNQSKYSSFQRQLNLYGKFNLSLHWTDDIIHPVEYTVSDCCILCMKQDFVVSSKVLTLGHTTTHSSYGGCSLWLRILYVSRLRVVATRHSRHVIQSRIFMTFLPFSPWVVVLTSTKE